MAVRTPAGASALVVAAGTSPSTPRTPPRSCAPLLLLLRRVSVEQQPNNAQQAHMTKVRGALCRQGPRWQEMFGQDQPDDVRDECICLHHPGAISAGARAPSRQRGRRGPGGYAAASEPARQREPHLQPRRADLPVRVVGTPVGVPAAAHTAHITSHPGSYSALVPTADRPANRAPPPSPDLGSSEVTFCGAPIWQ
jgi:hypothetical protein